MPTKLFSLPQAAEILGQSYDRVWYAVATQKIKPQQAGRSRLLTSADLNALRRYFEGKEDRC